MQSVSYINLDSEIVKFKNENYQEEYLLSKNRFFGIYWMIPQSYRDCFAKKQIGLTQKEERRQVRCGFAPVFPHQPLLIIYLELPGLSLVWSSHFFSAELRWVKTSESIPDEIMYPKILRADFLFIPLNRW